MSAHTKMHPTRPRPVKKRTDNPRTSKRARKTIPWRKVAKREIEKYSEVGLVIRGSRFKEGYTQKKLAELLEVKPHHISEMEHGKRSVGKTMAQRLGKVFKVDYRVFL
jgi:ribosome-binding protein aMBF1 (putative translation factor)